LCKNHYRTTYPEHITPIPRCNYSVSARHADNSDVHHLNPNQLKSIRSTVVLALLALSSGTACANIHGIAREPRELPSFSLADASIHPAREQRLSQTPLANSNRYFRAGVRALHADNYADAIADFTEVLALRRSTAALINRGFAYRQLGDPNTAIANYTAALENNPRSADALVGRANAYAMLGKYNQALADCDSALSIQPDKTRAHTTRGYVLASLHEFERAGDDYLFVARQESTIADAYRLAGDMYARARRYEEAVAAYHEAIRLAPTQAQTYVMRARANSALHNPTAALADFVIALRIDPADTDAYWGRGLLFEQIGNYQAAAADYEALEHLLPGSSRPHVYRADILTRLGHDEEARKEYATAEQLGPNDTKLLYGRLQFRFYQGEYAAAISDADAWLRIDAAKTKAASDQQDAFYVLIWRHMAAQRLGVHDDAVLKQAAMNLDHQQWPYPLIAFYLGRIGEAQLRAFAATGDSPTVQGQQCELSAYVGESAAARGLEDDAKRDLTEALHVCPVDFIERSLVSRDLQKLETLPIHNQQ
jgi:tetratricopeptide (TPR) repeat protein